MNFWTGVHFLSFVVYAFSVFYVIIKNPYAVTNWVLSVIFCYFALWSACSCVLDNTGLDFSTAGVVMRIQSVGWASFVSYYLLFILHLTNNKKLLSMPLLYVAILLIPGIFIWQNYNGEMIECCRKTFYGVAGTWKNSVWTYCYFAYYTVIFFWGTYLLFRHRNSTRIKSEKRVMDILLASAAVVFTMGTVFSVFMNFLGIYNPVDVNVVFLIFVGGFVYSAEKYEVFTISSARNADRIIDLINEGIVLLDREGSLTTANRAAKEIFGYSEGTQTKDNYGFMEHQIKNAGVIADGDEVTNFELTFKDSGGTEKTVLVSGRTLLKDRANSGRVCTIRDITGKKKIEVDLVESVMELKRSNEELESFAYVASHDLKEPLRMVTSYVQLIRKKFLDKIGRDGNDYINFASDGAIRMSALIEGLLEYSRVRKARNEFSMVETSAIVDKVLNTMKFIIQDKKATIGVKDQLPVIKADSTQIEQLFQNIIGNALKFTGNEPPVIAVSAERRGNNYQFTVKDNGIGMDMQYNEKIFQIFQRLHGRNEYEGTGMGLAICKKITESHGGKIWVESDGLGKGCSLCFTLPDTLRGKAG